MEPKDARSEIVKVGTGFDDQGIQIRNMEDAVAWANAVIASGFAPGGFGKASQVVVAVQMGRELGLGPMASLRAIYVPPSGRPSLMAESAMALVLKSGLLQDWQESVTGEGDAMTGTFRWLRKGAKAWQERSFSVGEAKKAGLVKDRSGWVTYAKRMVAARAKAWGLKDGFADVLLGIPLEGYIDDDEEMQPQRPQATSLVFTASVEDPLLEAALGPGAAIEVKATQVVEPAPQTCQKHGEDLEDGACWKCEAEAEEKGEGS
jgi:hypothetical protein